MRKEDEFPILIRQSGNAGLSGSHWGEQMNEEGSSHQSPSAVALHLRDYT